MNEYAKGFSLLAATAASFLLPVGGFFVGATVGGIGAALAGLNPFLIIAAIGLGAWGGKIVGNLCGKALLWSVGLSGSDDRTPSTPVATTASAVATMEAKNSFNTAQEPGNDNKVDAPAAKIDQPKP